MARRPKGSTLTAGAAPPEDIAATLVQAIEAGADAAFLLRPIAHAGAVSGFRCIYANRRCHEAPFAASMPILGRTLSDALAGAPELGGLLQEAYADAFVARERREAAFAAGDVSIHQQIVPLADALWVASRAVAREHTGQTAEEKAKAAEETLHDAIETITVGFILYGPDRRVIAYNQRLAEMFPENAERLRRGGATFDELQRAHMVATRLGWAQAEIDDFVAERGRDFDNPRTGVEFRLPGNRWVLVNERRTRAGGLVGTRTDVTEIKRREQALSILLDHPAGADTFGVAARALATALGYRFAGVGLISADGQRVELQAFWNGDHLADPISYPLPESPCGTVCHSRRLCFYPAAVADRFPQAALLRQLGAVSYIGDIFHDKDGNAVGHVFALNDAPDVDSAEKRAIVHLIAGWVGLECQRRWAEKAMLEAKEQAENANRTKGLFLANMGHELRTPLNAIIGFAQMLAGGYGGPLAPRQAEYLRDIEASGSHLLQLVNDLLDLSKAEAGRLELNETTFRLTDTFAAVRQLVRDQLEPAGVALEVQAPEPGLRLVADELKLRQILLNLLTNALKFTPPGGTVTLEAVREPDGGATLRVRDTGVGIAPADVERVFTRYVRLETPLARHVPGTGLGLPLSRALTELHGGTLTLESIPGRGTTATLRLPPARVKAAD